VDESALVQEHLSLVVQVNGKVRGKIEVAASATKEEILKVAKAEENVVRYLQGETVRKEIVVPNKLVNIVVG
jgi:leucyl-tRNA synthetase